MMPFNLILIALANEIRDALAGKQIRRQDVKVRHHRHRESTNRERPCVAIRYMSNDLSNRYNQTQDMSGSPEQYMDLAVDLVIDADLAPEERDPASTKGDPTGYGDHSEILEIILDRLIPDPEAPGYDGPNTLGGLVFDVVYDGTSPDEGEATPDMARLEERLTLIYRVRADHPTTLLRS